MLRKMIILIAKTIVNTVNDIKKFIDSTYDDANHFELFIFVHTMLMLLLGLPLGSLSKSAFTHMLTWILIHKILVCNVVLIFESIVLFASFETLRRLLSECVKGTYTKIERLSRLS